MALIKCKECGNLISNKAERCPNCGIKFAPRPRLSVIGLGVVLGLFAIVAAIVFNSNTPDSLISKNIKLEVVGSATSASVTYTDPNAGSYGTGTAQESNVSLPWEKEFTANPGTILQVLAQNKSASGSITANIYVDGTLVKTVTSTGGYVISHATEQI